MTYNAPMRVMNIMLSKGVGGIEVAFAHYATALAAEGMDVTCCVAANAKYTPDGGAAVKTITLPHGSQLDPTAIWRARQCIKTIQPDVIVVHGRRAYILFALALKLVRNPPPLVQVLHRPRFKRLCYSQHVITVSEALRAEAIAHGCAPANVTYIPNFLPALPEPLPVRPWHTPPVIGLLARFVPEKGIDLFIEALAILKQRGITPDVRIGGCGASETQIKSLAEMRGVDRQITWLGWVDNQRAFYESIDLFCLPSRMESFGLVVLEAFAYGVPVISTRTSGPSEIISDGQTGIMCDITPLALADSLAKAIDQPANSHAMAAEAMRASQHYTREAVAPKIAQCLRTVVQQMATTRTTGVRGAGG